MRPRQVATDNLGEGFVAQLIQLILIVGGGSQRNQQLIGQHAHIQLLLISPVNPGFRTQVGVLVALKARSQCLGGPQIWNHCR